MKNILNKIKINYITYYIILLSLFCGFIKNIIILFLLIIIHEIGHLIVIKIFDYKINKITIYPYGGVIEIEKIINSSIIKDIIISISGVIFQLIGTFILLKLDFFSIATKELIYNYSLTIAVFNMLPIIPLDGSKTLENILNLCFSYKLSYFLSIVISIFSLGLFLICNYIYSLNNYIIGIILITYIIDYIKKYKFHFNKFLLERILYDIPYKKINNDTKNLNHLKKEQYHYFKENEKYQSETTKIKKKFDKSTYI